jgi:hypothetical protein
VGKTIFYKAQTYEKGQEIKGIKTFEKFEAQSIKVKSQKCFESITTLINEVHSSYLESRNDGEASGEPSLFRPLMVL